MIPETTVPQQEPYTFSTGLNSNLGAFTDSLRPENTMPQEEPAMPSDFDEADDTGNIPVDFPEEQEEDSPRRRLGKSVAESGGKSLARAIDRVAAVVLALLAHGEADDYRADKGELTDLQDALVEFMQETGFVMSPGWNLLVAMLSIYGFKAKNALSDRKANMNRLMQQPDTHEIPTAQKA